MQKRNERGDEIDTRSLHEEVERFYEETRQSVYAYAVMLGLPPAAAQEAVQEAFLRYFVARRKAEVIENPRAWIFRVTHNFCLKARAKAARSYPLDDELAAKLHSSETNIERSAIDRERMQQLHAAMSELSPQQKRCLFLRAEGLRYHEIADTVGISASSVGEFLKRAITRLRKAVGETK